MVQTCRWNSPHFSGYLYINRSWFHLKYTFIALHSVPSCAKSDHLTFISPGYLVAFWQKSVFNSTFDSTDDFLHQTTQFKWKQGTFLVILHDGIYIYRYTFSIFQYTFIGWVRRGPAANLYQVHAWDTPPGSLPSVHNPIYNYIHTYKIHAYVIFSCIGTANDT